jgi:hypothetical protein
LQSVILLLCIIIWRWYLVEMRCILSCHNLFLKPIGIWIYFSHQLHFPTIFIIMTHWLAQIAIWTLGYCLILMYHWKMIWIMPMCFIDLAPWSSYWKRVW